MLKSTTKAARVELGSMYFRCALGFGRVCSNGQTRPRSVVVEAMTLATDKYFMKAVTLSKPSVELALERLKQ